jgi:hypothetical protein
MRYANIPNSFVKKEEGWGASQNVVIARSEEPAFGRQASDKAISSLNEEIASPAPTHQSPKAEGNDVATFWDALR